MQAQSFRLAIRRYKSQRIIRFARSIPKWKCPTENCSTPSASGCVNSQFLGFRRSAFTPGYYICRLQRQERNPMCA